MPRLIGAVQATQAGTQAQQITTFNSSGTFAAQPKTTDAWVLVVAGGGGGASSTGSGGGAGGHLEVPSHPLPLSPVPVTVGAGGAAGQFDPAGGLEPVTKGQPGNNSVFGAAAPLTAIGGGGGVRGISGTPKAGDPGGSGGGGYRGGNGGTGTPGQGNRGGNASPATAGRGGGGGAGAAGTDVSTPGAEGGATGGAGLSSSITGSPVYRGGGGASPDGTEPLAYFNGGIGGGGNTGLYDPSHPIGPYKTDGTANTGGGGAGGMFIYPYQPTAAIAGTIGGSGTVIVNEPQVDYVDGTSSVWDLRAVFRAVKAGNWTN